MNTDSDDRTKIYYSALNSFLYKYGSAHEVEEKKIKFHNFV